MREWRLRNGMLRKLSRWLDTAAQLHAADWGRTYIAGILACLRADMPAARSQMETSLGHNPFQSRVRFELGVLANELGEATGLSRLESHPWSTTC